MGTGANSGCASAMEHHLVGGFVYLGPHLVRCVTSKSANAFAEVGDVRAGTIGPWLGNRLADAWVKDRRKAGPCSASYSHRQVHLPTTASMLSTGVELSSSCAQEMEVLAVVPATQEHQATCLLARVLERGRGAEWC